MTRALIDPRLTTSIRKTHLGRDTGLELYRETPTVDGEGNPVSATTHICTFLASLGEPRITDIQLAGQRGATVDAVMIYDPTQTVTDIPSTNTVTLDSEIRVGDQVWARGKKWRIANVFKQIVTRCHLMSFDGVDRV